MADPVLLIVRRGALRCFANLQRKASALNVEVMWDRRQRERRQANDSGRNDQRTGERRRSASSIWQMADFEVAVRRDPGEQ